MIGVGNLYFPSTLAMTTFLLCFYGWTFFEIGVNLRRWGEGSTNQDRWTRYRIIAGMVLGFFLAVQASWRFGQFAITWQRDAVFWLGVVVMVSGVALRYLAIQQLGRFFVPEVVVQRGQRVIDTGFYRYVRHPSYTGILIGAAGYGLVMTNWLSILIMLIAAFIPLVARVQAEEVALLAAFGDEYRDYMGRTKRFIPFVI